MITSISAKAPAHRFMLFFSIAVLLPVTSSADFLNPRCEPLLHSEDFDLLAKEVESEWEKIRDEYEWRVWVDSPADYRRFINTADLEAANPLAHPIEIYPNALEQYRGMKAGGDYLASIPRGKFNPTVDMIRELHRIAMKEVYSLREKITYRLGRGLFNVVGPGELKRFANFGFSPLTRNALTDAQVAQIRADGLITFWSFFRSGPDRNYGVLVFPGSPERRLRELLTWYEGNRTRMNPIELAAQFQRRFVAIHPFDSGNGRISRLIMDRILAEHGLPPAIVKDHNLDLYVSQEAWTREVANGVAEFQQLARTALRDSKKNKMSYGAPFVGQRDHGVWIKPKGETDSLMNSDLFPERGKANFKAQDGKTYILYRDGFFYGDSGVPHSFRDGTLYPIADHNYTLYGLGGHLFDTEKHEKGQYRRALTSQASDVYSRNLEAVHRIADGTLDPTQIRVHAYGQLSEANRKGEFYFHSWERQWLKNAFEIRETNPAAILAMNRGGFTEFEQAYINQGSVRISSILAQYQAVDLNYARLEQHFRRVEPDAELAATIGASRKKLWGAIRHYVVRFEQDALIYGTRVFPEIAESAKIKELIREVPQFKLFYEYLPYTRAGYATWDEAVSEIPWNQIYLLRNDFKAVRWVGFISESQFARLINAIPGAGLFKKYVRRRLAGVEDAKAFELASADEGPSGAAPSAPKMSEKFTKLFKALEQKIFVSPYTTKGADERFQRAYVDLYLHAADRGRKPGVSFTTRTDQMIRNDGELSFQGVTGARYQTYIVQLPVERSMNNFASGWFRQYEVVVRGYSRPTRIVKTLGPEDYQPTVEPAMIQKFDEFITRKQMISVK